MDNSKITWKEVILIEKASKENIDLYKYKDLQFSYGLEDGLDISIYAKLEFSGEQMEQIRYGLEKGLDVSVYAKPEYEFDKMEWILEGLENKYIDPNIIKGV